MTTKTMTTKTMTTTKPEFAPMVMITAFLEGNRQVAMKKLDDDDYGVFISGPKLPKGQKVAIIKEYEDATQLYFQMKEDTIDAFIKVYSEWKEAEKQL